MENSPQVVFERLFGDGANSEQRLSRKKQDRSILDSVTDKVARLQGKLDPSDRARFGEYLDDIREIERRIQKATEQAAGNVNLPEAPVGIPEAFEDHIKLMFDLTGARVSRRDHTHFDHDVRARYQRRNVSRQAACAMASTGRPITPMCAPTWTASRSSTSTTCRCSAYFLRSCRATPDGDGNLLDHSAVLYGSSMSNGNQHDHDPLPILVAGGASGTVEGRTPPGVSGAHAYVEPDAVTARQAGSASGQLRRQHCEIRNLKTLDRSRC